MAGRGRRASSPPPSAPVGEIVAPGEGVGNEGAGISRGMGAWEEEVRRVVRVVPWKGGLRAVPWQGGLGPDTRGDAAGLVLAGVTSGGETTLTLNIDKPPTIAEENAVPSRGAVEVADKDRAAVQVLR